MRRSFLHSLHPNDRLKASIPSDPPALYSKQRLPPSFLASFGPQIDSNSARSAGSASTLSSDSQTDQRQQAWLQAPLGLALAWWEHTAEFGVTAASLVSPASLAQESTLLESTMGLWEEYTAESASIQHTSHIRIHSLWAPSASELQAQAPRLAFGKMNSLYEPL